MDSTNNVKASPVARVVPASMTRINTEIAKGSGRKSETAFANDVEGQCPVCQKQMKLSSTNNIDVHVCLEHRVVMPIKNEA